MGQPALRVRPSFRPQLAKNLVLGLGPERSCDLQGPSPFRGEPHRLDPPVGVRRAVDHPLPLQKIEAARQRGLVEGERVFELPQVRFAHARDGRENAELRHPEPARP